MWILLALLCGFTIALVVTSRRLHLYSPTRLNSFLHEQRLSVQACFTSGLLLTGTLYLVHAEDIPRGIVLITMVLVTVSLSLRRLIYRICFIADSSAAWKPATCSSSAPAPKPMPFAIIWRAFAILATPSRALSNFPACRALHVRSSGDVVGTLDTLFQHARKQFVDEIFFTTPCERGIVQDVLEKARMHGVDLRVVPDLYDGLAWNSPIEYVGQFPNHSAAPRPCAGARPALQARVRRLFLRPDRCASFALSAGHRHRHQA